MKNRLKVFNALYGTEVIPLAIGGNGDKVRLNIIKSQDLAPFLFSFLFLFPLSFKIMHR